MTVSGLRDLPTHERQARSALDFESVYVAPGRLGNADGVDWAQVHDQDPTAGPTDANESLTHQSPQQDPLAVTASLPWMPGSHRAVT